MPTLWSRNSDVKLMLLNFFHCLDDFYEHESKELAIRVEKLIFLGVFHKESFFTIF